MSAVLKKISTPQQIEDLRAEIDSVDKELIALLEKRASLVFAIGDYKKKYNMPIHDPVRELKIRSKIKNLVTPEGPLKTCEMESLVMTIVERFRFFESIHLKKNEHLTQSAFFDFSKPIEVILWGFGLLGSSLYLALKDSLPHWKFRVVDPYIDVDKFMLWKNQNMLINIDLINSQQMNQANLYILAGPIKANAEHIQNFNFPENSLVIDLGSTKEVMHKSLSNRSSKISNSFVFVGGHPLAGQECSGFENGNSMLFYNKTFCWIHPDSQSNSKDSKIENTLNKITSLIGAQPLWLTASDHDAALAWTSHLPQILSGVLATCISKKEFSETYELFPGVIRELLRISGSSFSMWQSIIETNQDNLQKVLSEFIEHLTAVQKELQSAEGCKTFFLQSNEFYNKFNNRKIKTGV